jgi:hypothetical protein
MHRVRPARGVTRYGNRRINMSRRALKVAHCIPRLSVLLLMGGLINYVVSWGWMMHQLRHVDRLRYERRAVLGSPEPWPETPLADWPAPNLRMQWQGFGFLDVDASHFNRSSGSWGPLMYEMTIVRVGWPMAALKWRIDRDSTYRRTGTFGTKLIGGIAFDKNLAHRVGAGLDLRLPLVPLWPGFLLNSLLYAATAAPLMLYIANRMRAALTWMRGLLRLKRGLCPMCGYPVGLSNVCTECGTAIEVRSRSRRV